ncbi:MAG: mechanosensitive ion channel family protein [Microcystaceae cyanobacterium]
MAAFIPALRIFIWTVAIVFLLDNLGLNIAAMVASLGIGGVAIALASQGILQDLFSYFSILFDRPFEIGDLVQIDNYIGHIEYVGIKTTRIKELSGEELILANTDLTSSRIQNFKRMERRRVVFMIGVIYETDLDTLQIIPSLIQKAIEATENVIFDRAHFANYNDFSLDFEITYYVLNNSYLSFREAQQNINFNLKEAFDKHNIQFAYPTQVAYLNPMSSNALDQSDKLSPS